ncbi:MAG: hypothetical protein QOI24_3026 [Acidobacteriota bacterium]|jgi:hypothetical protein|nr:hypothetical protein [Acidobacteriota bacterium]
MEMMKRVPLFAALLLCAAGAAFADEATPAPDYSREALLLITRDMPARPVRPVSFAELGVISIRTPFGRAHVSYLPLPPLQGSLPRTTLEWPNPFALTNTEIAMTPETFARH